VDVQFVYVFCDGNAAADVKEYKKQFANWWTPDWWVFSHVHRYLQEIGEFLKLAEHPVQHIGEEEVILKLMDSSPSASVCRLF
jgi:hypothetical protein